jgi:ATP-dependent helicase/nuclease subunit A
MTVHKAKGLEFPVVILVDPTAPATTQKPSRYVDPDKRLWSIPLGGCVPIELIEQKELVLRHDREEALRLLYVAATRAREMLVVPVVGDESTGSENVRGWVDALHPVLYPRLGDRRNNQPAPGCPPFGEDSVYFRPESVPSGPQGSVRPGLHRPEVGEHRVVFWDPFQLELDKKDDVGLRQQRILAADEGGSVATEGERLHEHWVRRREALLARGGTPSIRVETVTEQKERGAPVSAAGMPIGLEQTAATREGRPHGKRFGVLVHAVLATVPLDAGEDLVRDMAMAEGRLLGASDEEVAAAAVAATAALAHPLLARARAAKEARRECPVTYRRDDGSLVEGVIDLVFCEEREQRTWCVVDFKTDVELHGRKQAYEIQVATYAAAVRAATGEAVSGFLLSV